MTIESRPDPSSNQRDSKQLEFVVLLGECDTSLRAYVVGLLGSLIDAEEVLQETRIKLWQEFSRYDRSRSFEAWARSIAYFEVLSFRKRRSRDRLLYNSALLELLKDEFEEMKDELSIRQELLEACMKRLSRSSQVLLLRCYAGDESQREIASKTNRSFDGLRQTLARLRKKLHDCINTSIAARARSSQ